MLKKSIRQFAVILALALSNQAAALNVGLNASISNGGDKLPTGVNNNDFKLGDGISFGLNLQQAIRPRLSLTASFDFRFKVEEYVHGSITYTSIPVSLGVKMQDHGKLGMETGIQTLIQPELSGTLVSENLRIKAQPGVYGELSFKTDPSSELCFRYTHNLKLEDHIGNIADASHFSLIARLFF